MYSPQYRSSCVKIKLKPESLKRAQEWRDELTKRRDETKQTLIDEGVFWEAAFLDKQGDDDYLIMVVKYENDEKLQKAVAQSQHDIDMYHRKFKKDTRESWEKLENILDLENF